ncbi:MAG: cobaltochelatase subunit CobN, partial [Pseudomonadota bacterium]
MHVLAIESGALDTGDEAVDLGQSPADVVVLSAADTELALLARAHAAFFEKAASSSSVAELPTLRLANVLALKHNFSVDLYIEKTLRHAKLIVVRLLGGRPYWSYGLEQIALLAAETGAALAILPGDDKADPSLDGLSTVADERAFHLWRCLSEGGAANADRFLEGCAAILSGDAVPMPPRPIPRADIYATLKPATSSGGRAAIVFYRALLQSGDTGAIDAMGQALAERGLSVDIYAVQSLRDGAAVDLIETRFAAAPPDIVINTTSFAAGATTATRAASRATTFGSDAIWLQAVLSSQSETTWRASPAGLPMRDVAMHVSLPEFDGRVLTRAVAFKQDIGRDPRTEFPLTEMAAATDRISYVADLAAAWVRLRKAHTKERRVAIVLANYPNRDGRIANGVGLATPESVTRAMETLRDAGYAVADVPNDGDALIDELKRGPTNATHAQSAGVVTETLPLDTYEAWFATLPLTAQRELVARWGPPSEDPTVRAGAFALALR